MRQEWVDKRGLPEADFSVEALQAIWAREEDEAEQRAMNESRERKRMAVNEKETREFNARELKIRLDTRRSMAKEEAYMRKLMVRCMGSFCRRGFCCGYRVVFFRRLTKGFLLEMTKWRSPKSGRRNEYVILSSPPPLDVAFAHRSVWTTSHEIVLFSLVVEAPSQNVGGTRLVRWSQWPQ